MQSLLQSNTQSHLTFAGRRQVQTNTSVCVCVRVCVHHEKVFCILLSSKRLLVGVRESLPPHLLSSTAWVFITVSREPGCLKGTLFITMTPPPPLHPSFHRFSFSRRTATGTYSPGLYRGRLTRKLAHLLPLPSREKMCQLMNEKLKKNPNPAKIDFPVGEPA